MIHAKRNWLVFAFVLSFLTVGIPYWLIPYNKVSLPSTLMGPALLAVPFVALMIRAYGKASFWSAVTIVGASVPAAVFARVIIETGNDPTSHNLWPLEVIIALFVGFSCALAGALAGSLVAKLIRKRNDGIGS